MGTHPPSGEGRVDSPYGLDTLTSQLCKGSITNYHTNNRLAVAALSLCHRQTTAATLLITSSRLSYYKHTLYWQSNHFLFHFLVTSSKVERPRRQIYLDGRLGPACQLQPRPLRGPAGGERGQQPRPSIPLTHMATLPTILHTRMSCRSTTRPHRRQ
eukprot:1179471-Prorocentrum_minimum.AAC.2